MLGIKDKGILLQINKRCNRVAFFNPILLGLIKKDLNQLILTQKNKITRSLYKKADMYL